VAKINLADTPKLTHRHHRDYLNSRRMKILFFDTETNGLPLSRNALTRDVNNWPRIVQIAWELWEISNDGHHRILQDSYIIRPDESLPWNNESAAIHGITKERALAEGTPHSQVLAAFAAAASQARVLCAHNLAFDKPVLRAEYYRQSPNESFKWWPPMEYCTMQNSIHLCKLPSKYPKPNDPYKYPRLSELYKYLFGTEADFAWHSAAGDVQCLTVCFQELVRRRLVTPLERLLALRVTSRSPSPPK
jgi:DNA polymerase-3 subunit epsilon